MTAMGMKLQHKGHINAWAQHYLTVNMIAQHIPSSEEYLTNDC